MPRPHLFLPWCAEIAALVHDKPLRDDAPVQDELLRDDAPVLDEPVHHDAPVLDEQWHDDAPLLDEPVHDDAPVHAEPALDATPAQDERCHDNAPMLDELADDDADADDIDNDTDKVADHAAIATVFQEMRLANCYPRSHSITFRHMGAIAASCYDHELSSRIPLVPEHAAKALHYVQAGRQPVGPFWPGVSYKLLHA